MKKLFFMLPVLMLPFLSFAQQNQIPTIEVDGASEIEVMPDEATIQINLRELGMKVSDVTNALNKKTKAIQDAIKKTGVADYDFVVDNYYVNINRIYTKGSSKDSGYVASQNVKVRVKNIDKDLVKVLESISSKDFDLSYNMNFGISEAQRKVHQEKLLELALEDARRKADVIAKTMGIKNIRIFKVNFRILLFHHRKTLKSLLISIRIQFCFLQPKISGNRKQLSELLSSLLLLGLFCFLVLKIL